MSSMTNALQVGLVIALLLAVALDGEARWFAKLLFLAFFVCFVISLFRDYWRDRR